MGGLRCPKCGRHIVRRSHRLGVVERLLSAVYVYPFRCQFCGRRFRALQWGKRYVAHPAERREYERVAVRAPLAVVTDGRSVEGKITELSVEGCTATTAAPLREGATVRVEVRLLPGEPPVAVEAAVVRSVRGSTCGLNFVRLGAVEQVRLRALVAGLLRGQHDAPVPEGPDIDTGRLRHIHSADFWLAAALLVLIALAVTMLPWFSLCTWGVNC
jgi:hypothetical protein